MKILSPVGNFESLKMAVFYGADEVYLGINDFNARNNIDGFNLSNLKEAVVFAHIYDVKVNLAINILFANHELQPALDTIVEAYNMGVDCFIVQDLGLAHLVAKFYPEIEIHASTQMGLHNLEGVKAVERFGFKRVVLARETPIKEIRRIKQNSSVELEYFAQGALCVAFSGNCYLSAYLCNASGNRGKCKQLCRLPYTLEKDGKAIKTGYLLSAKDFNMIDRLDDLKQAGVDVIKIEGRARRPFYVAIATHEYYKAVNKNTHNPQNLKLAFNRDYTAGYFDGNGEIISKYNNHVGIFVGKVEKFVKGKNFNELYFNSNLPLSPKSTFKIFDKDKECNTISAYDLKEISKGKYKLTTTQKINVGGNVHLIVDALKEEQTLNFVKKRKISAKLTAQIGKPITIESKIGNKNVVLKGSICEKANNQPISKDELIRNFSKSEIFDINLEIAHLDNIFMPKQNLNEFRRNFFDKIKEELTIPHQHNLQKTKVDTDLKVIKFDNFQIVENLNEEFVEDNIIYSPNSYLLEDIVNFKNKCKQLKKNAYLDTPNFAISEDIELLKDIISKTNISIVANNYYALNFDTNIVIGAGLNVYNNVTAYVYNLPIITAESDVSKQIKFPYMTLRHCPMKNHLGASCANCPYLDNYTYKMDNGKRIKLKRKKLCSCTFYLTD